jgi:threonine synthase
LEILYKKGEVTEDDTAVCLLTAHSLKHPGEVNEASGILLEMEPTLEAISKALENI